MLAITRFRVPAGERSSFSELARAASDFFAGRPGCESAEILHNLDDPDLWVLVSRWADVGSYRRAYNGYEAKVVLTPLMLLALDEPSAFGRPGEVGRNVPRHV